MVKNIIFSLLLVAGLSLYAQENPKIDKNDLSSMSPEPGKIKKAIKNGDKYYKNGLYDAALQEYMTVYSVNEEHSPLNYKIAVSNLYGVNPKNALDYFERTESYVASDYYCLKGIALVYHKQYDDAKKTFNQYIESLPYKKARRMYDKVNRFISICDFSAKAMQDSLPVFIINAGPNVNSYFDDYSAVELRSPNSSSLYFTSRRPKDDAKNFASYNVFPERIMFSSEFVNGEASEAEAARLRSGNHVSVAGVDNKNNALLYYKGKERFGDVYRVQFNENNGRITNNKRLKKKISKKSTTEGSISFAENGDAYFISNRLGGQGGKDIWYAEKKGRSSFRKPVNLKNLNTPLNEESVFVSSDNNTLYFSSNGLPGMGGYDIYKSVRQPDGTWGDPVNMGYPINGPDDDLFYRLTSDTTLALFSSKRSEGFGGLDIYYIRNDLRIPFEISGNTTDIQSRKTLNATIRLFDKTTDMPVATVANDTLQQRYILNMEDIGDYYLQAEAPGYRSVTRDFTNPSVRNAKLQEDFELEKLLFPYTLNGYITDERTGKPVLAEILIKLSGKDDLLMRTVSDARTGFYSITMEDKADIDLSARATDYYDHNESLPLKNVQEVTGNKDITMQKSVITYIVTGVISSESDNQPLKANIIASKSGDEQISQTIATDENGKYELTLSDAGPFLMEVTSEGYFFANSILQFTDDSAMVIRNFIMKKMEVGVKMVMDNILFNTGNATLRPESFAALNKLVNLLKENPNVKIEVSGHTDNTGSASTNKTLSKNRALTVRNYLISQGIAGERVQYEGYGFDRPIAPNNTEEGRAANRRVEIEILD